MVKWNSTPQLSSQKPPSTPLVFALCRLLSLLILIFTSTTRNDDLLHCSPDCSVTASANMKKLLDINTTRHLHRPTLPNQEMNGEQSPVCLFGLKRMKLEWKRSSQLSKQPWLGIEPWPLRWADATFYPLSSSSQLERRPLWVCSNGNDMNWNMCEDHVEFHVFIRKPNYDLFHKISIHVISTIRYITNSQWLPLQFAWLP